MSDRKRVYNSPLRAEQAQRTRAAVLDAAARRFLDQGYAATTMKDVAAEAGVSVQTVFGQGSKAALLLACVDRAVVGDDEESPLAQRESFLRLVHAPDRATKLAAVRELVLRYVPEAVPILQVFAGAAAGDPEIAEAWAEYERRRFSDQRIMIASFQPELRDGLDVERATEIAWGVFTHALVANLMGVRGWTLEQYADFLVDAIERLLLN
ncbi:TetR/AcrR family transcriptional regulator [Petropleomorpha daqingensis]|uniref:AcrR family transcriptional regulator n=1 Tax=Petropleomorpha daqingensis TaxID=2026353 RepID=A0A853CFT1_9ACTN|nr:TetR/AcrR family transcriptional regulator [Petropleomorpha daqingensis]NYJ06031.1 AcrR family transcriptional regulator [Petropleomorpha daqingensis]